ncbi:MAG TPA: BCAM0308 family protein [Myxococcota bacterium]|nr:BCAM0308 family protein [Myxococcota bacterium]
MRRQRSKTHTAATLPRESATNKPLRSDPYSLRGKHPDPSACTGCGAIYRAGRWAWGTPPADAAPVLCGACRRAADDYPAGVVRLCGDYWPAHRDELLSLARHIEERERAEHPLKRIMRVHEQDGALEIATTDAKLARGIGKALKRAHHGALQLPPTSRENVTRVTWER